MISIWFFLSVLVENSFVCVYFCFFFLFRWTKSWTESTTCCDAFRSAYRTRLHQKILRRFEGYVWAMLHYILSRKRYSSISETICSRHLQSTWCHRKVWRWKMWNMPHWTDVCFWPPQLPSLPLQTMPSIANGSLCRMWTLQIDLLFNHSHMQH